MKNLNDINMEFDLENIANVMFYNEEYFKSLIKRKTETELSIAECKDKIESIVNRIKFSFYEKEKFKSLLKARNKSRKDTLAMY